LPSSERHEVHEKVQNVWQGNRGGMWRRKESSEWKRVGEEKPFGREKARENVRGIKQLA
jgi:hypothetical protein